MEHSKTVVAFNQVSLSLGNRKILQDITFNVNLGEFVYLVGRTGSGKSSILRLAYGDLKPDGGKIQTGDFQINNINSQQLPYARRQLGIIFQDFQLLPDRSVLNNIQFALKASGWKNKSKMKQRMTEVLVKVNMMFQAQAQPHQLSGGEQQRVAIARALVNDPIVIIADEPTGNLDPEASDQILQTLIKINRAGTAVLMATHDYHLIEKHPSRVVEVSEGKIRQFSQATRFLSQLRYW